MSRNTPVVIYTIGSLFVLLNLHLHAQEDETAGPVQAATNAMSATLQALELTTPIPASELPDLSETHGFYSVQNPDWPPLPADVLGLNVWPLGDGLFALDDREVDYSTLSGSYTPNSFTPSFTPTTNDLWLEITGKTNTTAYLVIHRLGM